MITGRRLLVVPLAVAAGWELMIDRRIVVVKEVRVVDEGPSVRTILVVSEGSKPDEEIEAVREDTKENTREVQGSILADGDKTTPCVEKEEMVED